MTIFNYPITIEYELNKDGSYSCLSLIEKSGKTYCVASSSYREIGAAPGSQWEIITDEDDYSSCMASDLVLTEENLFVSKYAYQRQDLSLSFSSYKEMVDYWNANSVRVGDRNSGNGVEMVFALQ
jgi:hypothetical protein